MAKWILKNTLTYDNGYLSDVAGNIVMLPKPVHEALEGLDYLVQKSEYQQKYELLNKTVEMPPFKPKSIAENIIKVDEPETPALDKAIFEAMQIMNDIDAGSSAKRFKAWLDTNAELANFVAGDKFVAEDNVPAAILDTPRIGNPLELTVENLREFFELVSKE